MGCQPKTDSGAGWGPAGRNTGYGTERLWVPWSLGSPGASTVRRVGQPAQHPLCILWSSCYGSENRQRTPVGPLEAGSLRTPGRETLSFGSSESTTPG